MKRSVSLSAAIVALMAFLVMFASPAGAQEVEPVDPVDPMEEIFTQIGNKIEGSEPGDNLGSAVALDAAGDTVIVGVPWDSSTQGGFSIGAVRVFDIDPGTGTWLQRGQDLVGDVPEPEEGAPNVLTLYGHGVDIDAAGDTIVLTSPRGGLFRVFDWDASVGLWVQRGAEVTDTDGMPNAALYTRDEIGAAPLYLSADGNVVAVGLGLRVVNVGEPVEGEIQPTELIDGVVKVFAWDEAAGEWVQRGSDVARPGGTPEGVRLDRFGSVAGLSADGDTLLAGTKFSEAGPGDSVVVFGWDQAANDWVQRGDPLLAVDPLSNFGFSVDSSADGNRVAIGAPTAQNAEQTGRVGLVRVLEWDADSANWIQRGSDLFGSTAEGFLGFSVAMSADGDSVVAGSPYDLEGGVAVATAEVFDWDYVLGDWTHRGLLEPNAKRTQFGYAVSVNAGGETVAIGAPDDSVVYEEPEGPGLFSRDYEGSVAVFRSGDLVAPVVTVSGDVTVSAVGPDGASVTFTASAIDAREGSVDVACDPVSGTAFPVGSTVVTCVAVDSVGNEASATFTVTVIDTTAPELTVPTVEPVAAVDANGAVVDFAVTATDLVDLDNVVVACSRDSGTQFVLGTTTVTCTATDQSENSSAPASFDIVVVDVTAPVITGPGDLAAEADNADGAVVDYVISATDNVNGDVDVICSQPSGSTFPVGTTDVTCNASDAAENAANYAFVVTVENVDIRTEIADITDALGELDLGGWDQLLLNNALSGLARANDDRYWVDGNTVKDSGRRAIDGLQVAIFWLDRVDDPTADALRGELLTLMRDLAQSRIDQAIADNGNSWRINFANQYFEAAESRRAAGDDDGAAWRYESAWQWAAWAS